MKLAGIIGETADGTLEYIGEPSRDIKALTAVRDKYARDDEYACVYLFDAGRNPCVCTKCEKKKGKK